MLKFAIPSKARTLLFFIPWFLLLAAAPAGLSQSSPSPDYAHAEVLIRQTHFDEAIAILRPLLASEPRNLKAMNLLGIALTQIGSIAVGSGVDFRDQAGNALLFKQLSFSHF